MTITKELAKFAVEMSYEKLPPAVIDQSKRLILDSIGCAVGGLATRKGWYSISLARTLAGPPEASILGTKEKVSVAAAAYATGELINSLDYEALMSPPEHATPYVLAAILSMAEAEEVSGEECIVATAVAHEITTRIASGLVFGRRFQVEVPDKGIVMGLPTPGYGLCTFGGVAASGRLKGLDADQTAQAMGIAGYQVPVPMLQKFSMTVPAGIPKYLSAGSLSQQEVMSVLSAAMGCTGDVEILDGDYGFWRAFGCDSWRPEAVIEALGQRWHFPDRVFYKAFPCCGAMQNSLALFRQILSENNLRPDDIHEVRVKLSPLVTLPVWQGGRVENHIDAQFNVAYVFSVLAYSVDIGPAWQTETTLTDDRIVGFMKKILVFTELDDHGRSRDDVEVVVGSDHDRKIYSKQGLAADLDMDDVGLEEKFLNNCCFILDKNQAEKVAATLLELEKVSNIKEIFEIIGP